MSIILIGFMGAGKSSLAKQLSKNYVDSDDYIEKKVNLKISEFIDQFGLSAFRDLEVEVLPDLIKNYPVIATGGGIVEAEENCKILGKEKDVIYLKASFETLLDRIEKDTENKRPLFESLDLVSFRKLYEKRAELYEKLASYTLDRSQLSLEEQLDIIKTNFEISE